MNRFFGHRGAAYALLAVITLFMVFGENLVLCLQGDGLVEAEWHHLHGINPFTPLQAACDGQRESLLAGKSKESNQHISIAQRNRSQRGRRFHPSSQLHVVLPNLVFQNAMASPEKPDNSLALNFFSQALSLIRTVFLLI